MARFTRRAWLCYTGADKSKGVLNHAQDCNKTGLSSRALLPDNVRRHPCAVHGDGGGGRAAVSKRKRAGLAHGGICHAARFTGNSRKSRDGLKKDGRGVEISRLIGRSLRQAVDLTRLGERTVTIDCDVLEADGGTRCASITGGFVALCVAVDRLIAQQKLFDSPIIRQVAAVSVGVVDGAPVQDLCYEQDSRAEVDLNAVMDENGNLIEVQGTGEHAVFSRGRLNELLDLAQQGVHELMQAQRSALGEAARWIAPRTPRLILATNNVHKVRELKALLAGKFDAVSMEEAGIALEVEETGETFQENALLKAQAVTERTGCAALADDSGLCVDALGGAPGVRSARYAGTHGDDAANLRLLLDNLAETPAPRTAHFSWRHRAHASRPCAGDRGGPGRLAKSRPNPAAATGLDMTPCSCSPRGKRSHRWTRKKKTPSATVITRLWRCWPRWRRKGSELPHRLRFGWPRRA